MESFDFRNIKIENKKYLIEASAGTGKTHSMSQIFIRLILEGIPADKILLVTFTNAAADEIKERILTFLMEVKAYLSNNKKIKIEKIINDNILKEYLDTIIESKLKEDAIKNIENSIFSFDIISVCTIHSFAMKLVKEFSNELGLGLDFEFGKNTEKIDYIILQKYLYSNFNRIEPLLERDFNSNKSKNDKVVVLKDLISNLKNTQKFYDNYKPPIKEELIARYQSENQKENSIQKYLDSIYDIEDLKEDFLFFYHIESSNLKKNYRVFNFNDSIEFLLDLFAKNEYITKKISDRFDIVIIDEFQDTDERQVKLFDILFSNKSIFYIGDPKQAIYGFRGGDLFNYLNIKSSIQKDCIFELNKSYRSTQTVIDFINNFSNYIYNENEKIRNFLNDQLIYSNIESGINLSNIKSEAKIIYFSFDDNIYSEKYIARFIKNKIYELKEKDENFKLEEIAILLKSKNAIDHYYKLFNEIGLPCALKINRSVFDSDEAIFVYYLLNAIYYRGNSTFVKKLLATPYFDYTFTELIENIEDIYSEVLVVLNKLYNYWKIFGIYSIFENIFLSKDNNLKRFKFFKIYDYERKLTNIRQIFEILTNYFKIDNLSIYNQIEFLTSLIIYTQDNEDEDFHAMRLESENEAVLISTIHSAKGLEYTTVFCPKIDFVENIHSSYPAIYFEAKQGTHQENEYNKKYLLTSNSNKEKKELYHNYIRLQNINLLYVALTRAKRYCYPVIIENTKNNRNKDDKKFFGKNFINKLNTDKIIKVDLNLSDTVKNFEKDELSENKLSFSELKEALKIDLDKYNSKIENIYSYSSISYFCNLAKSPAVKKDLLDIVMEFNPYNNEDKIDFEEKYSDFSGYLAGNIFHETMENIILKNFDLFKNPSFEILEKFKKISEKAIKKYYKNKDIIHFFTEENTKMIVNALKVTLPNLDKKICQLDNIYPEVMFFARAKDSTIKDILKIFNKEDVKNIADDKNLLIKGYFNGYIDLVFIEDKKIYFIDWKTNDLSQYFEKDNDSLNNKLNNEILKKVINKSNYDIQYTIYSAVLYQFVKKNELPYKFGGLYYCFVRYMNENENSGVFFKEFNENELENLTNSLLI